MTGGFVAEPISADVTCSAGGGTPRERLVEPGSRGWSGGRLGSIGVRRAAGRPSAESIGSIWPGRAIDSTDIALIEATSACIGSLVLASGERDTGAVAAGRRLFGAAGVQPRDVDVAMVVEPFSIAVPLALEQYGFCERGEGGPFIESGATRWPDGALPVNTHGGSNGEAFIHGVNHLPEAVRQLRGTACNQVVGAQLAFVCGAVSDPSGAVLLGADR